MRFIQDLPNEILLNIFRLGCDDLGFEPDPYYFCPGISHSRKRKEFIAVARLVCFRWHQLADLQSLPFGDRFWFAHLLLSLRSKIKDCSNADLATPNTFLRRLIQFRRFLSTSQGCDLVIDLDTGGTPSVDDGSFEAFDNPPNTFNRYQVASLEELLSIRLFLSGASEVLQQRNQILAIRVQVSQAPLQKHIGQLLAGLEPAPRLKLIQVSMPHSSTDHHLPLQLLASSTPIPGFGALMHRASNITPQERWEVNLGHLDMLCVPFHWLQDLDHRFTISCLLLWAGPDVRPTQIPPVFQQGPLCENLRELRILWLIKDTDPSLVSEVGNRGWILPSISFTHLSRLKLELSYDFQVYWLLSFMSCPRLTDVWLSIRHDSQFLTPSKWTATIQNQFPWLTHLQIKFDQQCSLDSLRLLDIFKRSPVRQLEILDVGSPFPATYNTSGMTKTIMGILSHFKPETVQIEAAHLKSVLAILEGLDRRHLRKASLSIGIPNSAPSGLSSSPSFEIPYNQHSTIVDSRVKERNI
jgi:hypothetical protein